MKAYHSAQHITLSSPSLPFPSLPLPFPSLPLPSSLFSLYLPPPQKLTQPLKQTFLAQEPTLFPGTLRANLDPQHHHPDAQITTILQKITAHLPLSQHWTPTTPIAAGGKNLSQGQRQLVGLARAMLRRSSVVILDEATASVDLETSKHVQRLLREEMGGCCTVITIAHRVEAVSGAEGVLELVGGRLKARGVGGEMMGSGGGGEIEEEEEEEADEEGE